jgi:hypothetical protein
MRSFIFSILIFIPGIIFSQISGIVMDKSSGYPLQYATVLVENEDFGTRSDIEGKFTIKEDIFNKTLVISAIGFITERIVASTKFLRIELKTKVYQMNDVFVTAVKNKSEVVTDSYYNDSVIGWYCSRKGLLMVAGSQMNSLRSRPCFGTALKRQEN